MQKHIYTENVVDTETGELTQRKWITKKVENTEHFIKVYLNDLKNLNQLSHAEFRILHSMIIFLEYNTNEFYLNRPRREELAKVANVTVATINKSLSRLTKKNVLLKRAGSTYQMNPKIFFNGEELQRAKVLELNIRYEICPEC